MKHEANETYRHQVGTGEYTTGFVDGAASDSDKKIGVVALSMFDLRRRGKVGQLAMVGTNGAKFPAIRELDSQDRVCVCVCDAEIIAMTLHHSRGASAQENLARL